MPRTVVVTPIYEDSEAAARLFRELHKSLGADVYIVAVDDGSVRTPVDPGIIAEAGLHGVVLRLKRNVGHQRAIAIGICYVADVAPDALCIVMDSDGEDLPETIPDLVSALDAAGADAAVASRASRVETVRFKAFYQLYRLFFRLFAGREISFGNFMALRPAAVKRLAAMQELWTHVAACLIASKLKIAPRAIHRGPRYAGQSRMNFPGLVLHGFRALMVFAEDVLVRVGLFCLVVMGVSAVGIAAAAILKAFGLATPGWFSVVLGVLVLILFQTGALTLMCLMLAGISRNSALHPIEHDVFVDEILVAEPRA
jgi:glycosyltransferase involved in cell wall biosynthesis